MSDDMIERVARAIYEARSGHSRGLEWALARTERFPYLVQARAAIAAMREPTPEMIEAGGRVEGNQFDERVWRSVIDAALEGK